MKKRYVIMCSWLLVHWSLNAQSFSNRSDTAFFVISKFVKVDKLTLSNLTYNGDTFFLNITKIHRGVDGIIQLEKKQADSSYFVFITLTGKKIEEGVWDGEHFTFGAYKDYYKNGQIKSSGHIGYTGNKIGKWLYYNRRGKLIKSRIYSN